MYCTCVLLANFKVYEASRFTKTSIERGEERGSDSYASGSARQL
jgi:hypothetical protein